MTAIRPTSNTDWGGTQVAPSGGEKAAGFATGDRPPAQWLNYLLATADGWVKYLHQEVTKTKLRVETAALAQAPVNLLNAANAAGVAVNPAGLMACCGAGGVTGYGDIRGTSLTASVLGSSSAVNMKRIVWNGILFMAVGPEIQSSPTGQTWTRRLNNGVTYVDVAADIPNNAQVAVAVNGNVAFSTGGTSWSTSTPLAAVTSRAIVRTGSQFVVVNSSGTVDVSANGTSWSSGPAHNLTTTLGSAVYFAALDAVVITGRGAGGWKVAYSIAGGAWVYSSLTLAGTDPYVVRCSTSGVYVVKDGQEFFYCSSDLETWTRAQHPATTAAAGSQVSAVADFLPDFVYASDLGVGAAVFGQFFSGNIGRSPRF